jgi:hypothetical protein
VALCHEAKFDTKFETAISFSAIEHDPHWKLSLKAFYECLNPKKGILFLSWGSARCKEHEIDCSPDGGYHARKISEIITELVGAGFYVHECFYEDSLSRIDFTCEPLHGAQTKPVNFEIAAALAFRNSSLAIGPQRICKIGDYDIHQGFNLQDWASKNEQNRINRRGKKR